MIFTFISHHIQLKVVGCCNLTLNPALHFKDIFTLETSSKRSVSNISKNQLRPFDFLSNVF